MAVQSFPLGRAPPRRPDVRSYAPEGVVITPNALEQLSPADVQLGLQRHQAGDWGDLGEEDW